MNSTLSSVQDAQTPIAAPSGNEETDVSLLAAIRAAIDASQVRLDCNFSRLRLGDSPVLLQADGNAWFIGSGVAMVLGWFAFQWIGVAAMAVVAVVVHLTLARSYVNSRIEKRVRTAAIKDVVMWRKLWRFGGVSLRRTDIDAGECRAPEGNWFDFARRLPPLAVGTRPGV